MAEYTELNGTALLLYSELVDNAVAMEADASPSDGFGFILKKVQRGEYWYLQQTLGGKKKQYFFGPDTKDVRQRIDDQKQRWEEKRLDQAAMERLVGATIAAGCSATNHRAYKVLNAVASSGLFRAGGVLVGSHAFVAIGNMIGVSWVRDTTVTDDVDLAAYDQAMIAVTDGGKPLGEVILDSDTGLLSVPMLNPKSPSTSFKVRGQQFRVDLITPMIGKGEGVQYVASIKSYADPVRFLDYILEDAQKAVLLNKAGVLVNVPNPARYALHKLVVAKRRPPTKIGKSRKDVAQAAQVIEVLLDQRPGDLWLALDAAKAFHKKFYTELKAGISKLDDELRVPLEAQL